METDPLSVPSRPLKESLFEDDGDARGTFVDRNKDLLGVFTGSSAPTANQTATASSSVDKRASSRLSVKVKSKVTSETEDPLSKTMLDSYDPVLRVTKENLTIRKDDEARIVAGLHSAARKQTTGAIYSVVVDLGKTGSLGIGVKDLADNILAVSMLKRQNCCPGPGEDAGIRLGDIIFGVNFIPTREGSKTLISIIKKESGRGKSHIHIQGWRCHQLCSDPIPGYLFPRADELLVQAYSLVQNKVFSDWERWNFIEILLGHMLEDLKMRTTGEEDITGLLMSSHGALRAKQMQVLDLERNILQAKGLRTALCVRVVHTKSHGDTVVYVLRVEDVESGLQWVVQRRYSDFFALNEELLDMTHFTKEVEFPRKRLSIRNTAKLVEMRIVALEQYMRRMLHILTLYATMDASASRTLRHLQTFLGVDNYLDCVHPPPLDDQRFIELMAYQFLNDFNSEACQQCVRFITTVDLDSVIEAGPEGYIPVLNYARDALSEVEQFVQQQHMSQMIQTLRTRRADLSEDQLRSFVRKCIRRQVEAALYLPLRRTVFRIVFSFLAGKSKDLQRAISMLQQATPKFLMVDPFVTRAPALPRTVKAFRRVIQAYLPADQGQLLIHAATAVMELHKECQAERNRLAALRTLSSIAEDGNDTHIDDSAGPPITRRLTDEVDMQYVSTKTPDLDIGLPAPLLAVSSAEERAATGDMDLPVTPKKPVVSKLRELFTRKKTTEDLFNSSGSDDDAGSVSSNSVYSTTPTAAGSYSHSLSLSAPNSPHRSQSGTSFIKRLIPRVTSGTKNLETADNLFVDEKKAFTVSVKSDTSTTSTTEHNSGANSAASTPPPLSRMPSLSGSIDDDLHSIQQHASLRRASSDQGDGNSDISPRGSVKIGIAETSRSPDLEIINPKLSDNESDRKLSVSTSTEEVQTPNLRHDESLLQLLLERPALQAQQAQSQAQSQELSDLTGVADWAGTEDSQPSFSGAASPTPSSSASVATSGPPATPGVFTRSLLEAMASNHVSVRESLSELHAPEDLKTIADAAGDDKAPSAKVNFGSASAAGGAAGREGEREGEDDGERVLASGERGEENGTRMESGDAEGEDALHSLRDDSMVINNTAEDVSAKYEAISADDFLPLFTYVLIQAGLPQLLLVKELMTALVNDEDSYGECGYYLATLEAATQHILDLGQQYEQEVLFHGGGTGTGPGGAEETVRADFDDFAS